MHSVWDRCDRQFLINSELGNSLTGLGLKGNLINFGWNEFTYCGD